VAEFEQAIQAWIDNWNKQPRPFVWTKTAGQVLDSIASYSHESTPQDTRTSKAASTDELQRLLHDRGLTLDGSWGFVVNLATLGVLSGLLSALT
jgi:hypothetical protein